MTQGADGESATWATHSLAEAGRLLYEMINIQNVLTVSKVLPLPDHSEPMR